MTAGRTSASAASAEQELVITRTFDAPPALVFKVWTTPEHLARWWGPQGCTMLSCTLDVRPGGVWIRHMRAPDGSAFAKRGVYCEVVEPERLVFTYATDAADGGPGRETVVTVTFVGNGTRTRVTLHQAAFETVASRDGHQEGWTSSLEHLARYLMGGREAE